MSNYSFNPLQLALKPLYEQAKSEDELFAKQVQEKESRTEKAKSFAECCEYIMGEAYAYAKDHRHDNMGLAGMDEKGLIGLIKHYYDEDDIKINVVSGAKAIVQGVPTPTKKADTKPTKTSKPKKSERPKETLKNTHIPMIRPTSEKDAKKGSKEQASHIVQLDIWGMLAGE